MDQQPLQPLWFPEDVDDPSMPRASSLPRVALYDHVFDPRRSSAEVHDFLLRMRNRLRDRLDYEASKRGHGDILGAYLSTFGPPTFPDPPLRDDPALLVRLRAAGVTLLHLAEFAGSPSRSDEDRSKLDVRYLLNRLARHVGLPATYRQFPLMAAQLRFPDARSEAIRLGLLAERTTLPPTPERPAIDAELADDLLGDYVAGASYAEVAARVGRTSAEVSSYLNAAAKRRDRRPGVTPLQLREEYLARHSPDLLPPPVAHQARTMPCTEFLRGLGFHLAKSSPVLPPIPFVDALPAIRRADVLLWIARYLATQPVFGAELSGARECHLRPIASALVELLEPHRSYLQGDEGALSVLHTLAYFATTADYSGRRSEPLLDGAPSSASPPSVEATSSAALLRLSEPSPRISVLSRVVDRAAASLADEQRTTTYRRARAGDAAQVATRLSSLLATRPSDHAERDAVLVRLGDSVRHLLVPAIERMLALPTPAEPDPSALSPAGGGL